MSKKCECGNTPCVVVPGIGQSKVDLLDKNGNKIKSAWPLDVKSEELLGELKGSFMKMMMFRRDAGFSDKLYDVISKAANPLASDNDGNIINNLKPVRFNYPVSECSEEDKKYVYKMVPFEGITNILGEDHMYFFAYNSFGSVYDTAAELDAYIQMVKERTGHDKVNLIPVSLGGSVSTAYLDAYGEKGDIERVLYFVAALDGSQLAGDILSGNLHSDDEESIIEMVIGGKAKDMASMMKMVPKGVTEKAVKRMLDAVLDTVILKSTIMWAVVPCHLYEELRDKYLLDKKYDVLRAKTDRFHEAHKNFKGIIEREKARGVEFFSVCGYGRQLPKVLKSEKMSSDGVINVSSASLGAKTAPLGETFPADYKQANIYCDKHNHISPDRTVDASTGLIPDSTWYFYDQQHDDVAYNDVALEIAKHVLTDKNFKSVFSDERFPQFNGTRNIKKIKYDLLPKATSVDRSKLFPGQLEVLDTAIAKTEEFMKNTLVVDNSQVAEIETLLREAVELVTSDQE